MNDGNRSTATPRLEAKRLFQISKWMSPPETRIQANMIEIRAWSKRADCAPVILILPPRRFKPGLNQGGISAPLGEEKIESRVS